MLFTLRASESVDVCPEKHEQSGINARNVSASRNKKFGEEKKVKKTKLTPRQVHQKICLTKKSV